MRGLNPKLMSVAVGIAWLISGLPFLTFAGVAAVTLSVAWFIKKLLRL